MTSTPRTRLGRAHIDNLARATFQDDESVLSERGTLHGIGQRGTGGTGFLGHKSSGFVRHLWYTFDGKRVEREGKTFASVGRRRTGTGTAHVVQVSFFIVPSTWKIVGRNFGTSCARSFEYRSTVSACWDSEMFRLFLSNSFPL